jgi:hypothetical protein
MNAFTRVAQGLRGWLKDWAASTDRDGTVCGDAAGKSSTIVLYGNQPSKKAWLFFRSPRDLIQASYSSILAISPISPQLDCLKALGDKMLYVGCKEDDFSWESV